MSTPNALAPSRPLARFSLWQLLANVGVILWGAYVRASGSGAGCGKHWPLCNGEVIPRAKSVQTVIEFAHRVTSGAVLVLAIVGVVLARKHTKPGDLLRKSAGAVLGFTVAEAFVGAAIVLLEHTAMSVNERRGVSITLHLVNTFALLVALTVHNRAALGRVTSWPRGPRGMVVAATMVLVLATGASGAIAALGDTLFPVSTLAEGFQQDLSPTAHVFVRLRVFHPIFATLSLAALVAGVPLLRRGLPPGLAASLAKGVPVLAALQYGVGLVNLALLAPIPLQLVHLLLADALWCALTWLVLELAAEENPRA
jgi:cytochrome c oxidase assembly protein subunit 15